MFITLAAALGAFFTDFLTRAAAVRADTLGLEYPERRPLLRNDRSGTVTRRTDGNVILGMRAGSHALRTLLIHVDRDRLRLAEDRVHKTDLHLHVAVLTLARAVGPGPGSAAAKAAAEERSEDIVQIVKSAAAKTTAEAAGTHAVHSRMTELIVGRPFLRVAEHFVGLVDFFKFFFCTRFLVHIRMVLLRQFSIGFFYFIIGSAFADAQDFIIVALFAHKTSPSCYSILLMNRSRPAPPVTRIRGSLYKSIPGFILPYSVVKAS